MDGEVMAIEMTEGMWETTEADFAEFNERVRDMVGWLGLKSWRIITQHGGVGGEATLMSNERVAILTFGTKLLSDQTPSNIAVHESLHVLTADLYHILHRRAGLDEYETDKEIHAVLRPIAKLVDVLMEKFGVE